MSEPETIDGGESQPDQQQPEIIDQQVASQSDPQKATEPSAAGRGLMAAAELVPMKDGVYRPASLADQIVYAQTIAKGQAGLPAWLRGNVGDLALVIDIAQNSRLSTVMIANHLYKPEGSERWAFDSQLFHALLIQSGRLKDAALHVEYIGEGPEMQCKVSGTLLGETRPRELISEKLKDMHPGHTEKNGRKYVKGSPLWDDKPKVQQFYDTSRDWTRMFCPIATMGLMDRYEVQEYPIGPAAADTGNGLRQRLRGQPAAKEGHQPGHADSELANIASEANGRIAPADPQKPAKPSKKGAKAQPQTKTQKGTSTKKDDAPPKDDPKHHKPVAKPAPEPKPRAEQKGQKTDTLPRKVPEKPTTGAEYVVYARDWIGRGGDPETAAQRWHREYEMRLACVTPMADRTALRKLLEDKHGINCDDFTE